MSFWKAKAVEVTTNFINKSGLSRYRYDRLTSLFKYKLVSYEDLSEATKFNLCQKLLYYKFDLSRYLARTNRCGKKPGYENVEYKMGSKSGLIRQLRKHRPDLVETGIKICEQYVKSRFNYSYAPVLHRKDDNGNYAWDNIEIMSRRDHDKLKSKQEQKEAVVE